MRAGWGWPRNRRPAFPRQGMESETATLMFGASPGRIAGPASQTSEPLGLPSERQSRPRSEGAYWGWPRWPRAKQRERVLTPEGGFSPSRSGSLPRLWVDPGRPRCGLPQEAGASLVLHTVGLWGPGARGPLVCSGLPAPSNRPRGLVQRADVDRVRVRAVQKCGLAMAEEPDHSQPRS